MKWLLALAVTLLFPFHMAYAYQQSPSGEIRYNPKERLTMPASKTNGLKAATNVVIKEVNFTSLPQFIQNQADIIADDCTKSGENKKLIKFYRYVSDATRDAGLSANYLVDLSGLSSKSQQACMVDSACNDDGCMLVGYLSTAYEKWDRHFFVRNKSWKYTHVENPHTKSVLTVFDLTETCKKTTGSGGASGDETCTSRRLWLENGFRDYNPNAVDSMFQIPQDETSPEANPEGAPDMEAPAESKTDAPAGEPAE